MSINSEDEREANALLDDSHSESDIEPRTARGESSKQGKTPAKRDPPESTAEKPEKTGGGEDEEREMSDRDPEKLDYTQVDPSDLLRVPGEEDRPVIDQDGVTKRFKNGIRADLYSKYLQLAKKIPLPQTAKDGTYKKYTQKQTQTFQQACSDFEVLIDIDIERHELSKDYDLSREKLEIRDENGVYRSVELPDLLTEQRHVNAALRHIEVLLRNFTQEGSLDRLRGKIATLYEAQEKL